MPVVIFFACLPSSPEGYAGQVILNKNPHLWMDTKWIFHAVYISGVGEFAPMVASWMIFF
jgi:hypothetical protein